MSNLIQSSFLSSSEREPPEKVLEDQSKLQGILNTALKNSLKYSPQNIYRGQLADQIDEWKKLTSDNVILQMVSGEAMNSKTIFPKNIILKIPVFKRTMRKTINESTEFVSPFYIIKKPDGGAKLILNLTL